MPARGQEPPTRDDRLSGFHGKSRYDMDVALYASVAALVVGVQQLSFRRDYNLGEWSRHFETQEAARTWMLQRIRVTIIAAYTVMVDLTRQAVRFVQEQHGSEFITADIDVICASADAVLHNFAEWSWEAVSTS